MPPSTDARPGHSPLGEALIGLILLTKTDIRL